MKKVWKVLGTIGSFFAGYFVFGSLLLMVLPDFMTNQGEISTAFGVLMGLVVAIWWYKNYKSE